MFTNSEDARNVTVCHTHMYMCFTEWFEKGSPDPQDTAKQDTVCKGPS